MSLPRSSSQETLQTLISAGQHDVLLPQTRPSDNASILTSTSDETLLPPTTRIFSQPIYQYTQICHLPVVSNLFTPGIQMFDMSSLTRHQQQHEQPDQQQPDQSQQQIPEPLLSIQTSMLSFLKKNSPLITIHHSVAHSPKQVYCKVYFKVLANNLTCYILHLPSLNSHLILYNNAIKSTVDFTWKDNKLRCTGTSASTFGTGLINLHLLDPASPSLCDDLITTSPDNIKSFRVTDYSQNPLYTACACADRRKVKELIDKATPLVAVPLGSLIDTGDAKLGKVKLDAMIKLFNATTTSELSDDSLVMCCILLVLREQEIRKQRGHRQPSFV